MASHPCTNVGDGDIYGLGVRIGLYLLWASGFIVRLLGSWSRVSVIRTTNNILCGALVLAEFIHLIDGSALSIDYLLSYYLTIALFYAESYNLVREIRPVKPHTGHHESYVGRKAMYRLYPDPSLIFQNVLFAFYTLLGAWFWQVGIHDTRRTACDDRVAIIFLFDLRSESWTTAATVLASLSGAIFTLILLIHLAYLKSGVLSGPELAFVRVLRGFKSTPGLSIASDLGALLLRPRPPRPRVGSAREVLRLLGQAVHFALINLVGPIVAIISVERMIRANRLQTPSIRESTGQMIALVTGATSFMVALGELYRHRSKRNRSGHLTPADHPPVAPSSDNRQSPARPARKRPRLMSRSTV